MWPPTTFRAVRTRLLLDLHKFYSSSSSGELHNLPEKSILVLRLLMSTKSYLLKLRCPTNLHDFLSLRLGCCNPSSKGYFAVLSCVYTSHMRTVNKHILNAVMLKWSIQVRLKDFKKCTINTNILAAVLIKDLLIQKLSYVTK